MLKVKAKETENYIEFKIKGKNDTLLENLTILNNIISHLEETHDLTYDDILEFIDWFRKHLKECSDDKH